MSSNFVDPNALKKKKAKHLLSSKMIETFLYGGEENIKFGKYDNTFKQRLFVVRLKFVKFEGRLVPEITNPLLGSYIIGDDERVIPIKRFISTEKKNPDECFRIEKEYTLLYEIYGTINADTLSIEMNQLKLDQDKDVNAFRLYLNINDSCNMSVSLDIRKRSLIAEASRIMRFIESDTKTKIITITNEDNECIFDHEKQYIYILFPLVNSMVEPIVAVSMETNLHVYDFFIDNNFTNSDMSIFSTYNSNKDIETEIISNTNKTYNGSVNPLNNDVFTYFEGQKINGKDAGIFICEKEDPYKFVYPQSPDHKNNDKSRIYTYENSFEVNECPVEMKKTISIDATESNCRTSVYMNHFCIYDVNAFIGKDDKDAAADIKYHDKYTFNHKTIYDNLYYPIFGKDNNKKVVEVCGSLANKNIYSLDDMPDFITGISKAYIDDKVKFIEIESNIYIGYNVYEYEDIPGEYYKLYITRFDGYDDGLNKYTDILYIEDGVVRLIEKKSERYSYYPNQYMDLYTSVINTLSLETLYVLDINTKDYQAVMHISMAFEDKYNDFGSMKGLMTRVMETYTINNLQSSKLVSVIQDINDINLSTLNMHGNKENIAYNDKILKYDNCGYMQSMLYNKSDNYIYIKDKYGCLTPVLIKKD